MSVKDVTDDLNRQLLKVSCYQDMTQGLVGTKSGSAVNHLFSSFKAEQDSGLYSVIVSEYAVRQMMLKCELRLISAFMNHDVISLLLSQVSKSN